MKMRRDHGVGMRKMRRGQIMMEYAVLAPLIFAVVSGTVTGVSVAYPNWVLSVIRRLKVRWEDDLCVAKEDTHVRFADR